MTVKAGQPLRLKPISCVVDAAMEEGFVTDKQCCAAVYASAAGAFAPEMAATVGAAAVPAGELVPHSECTVAVKVAAVWAKPATKPSETLMCAVTKAAPGKLASLNVNTFTVLTT